MKTLDLSGTWRLRAEFTDTGIERFTEVLERPEGTFLVDLSQHQGFTADNDSPFPSMSGTIPARVPCDVLTALGENGLIGEPLEGTNTRNLLWTAKLSWWFISFTPPFSPMSKAGWNSFFTVPESQVA